MKKGVKSSSLFSDKVITFTTSEELSNLKHSRFAVKKLDKANKILRELKTPLPR